jgi:hypothetical protein
MQFRRGAQFCSCLFLLLFAAGCTTYYRIIDQPTRRTYYTTDFDRTYSGAVRFYDEKSLSEVTLQSSEIIEITKNAFEEAIKDSKPVNR